MARGSIHRLSLLVLATLAFLTLSLPPIVTLAVHYTAVTPDNSVLLANALGQQRNFNGGISEPICFIKIHSVQDLVPAKGEGYVYTVQGCVVHDFRGFGVCRSGDCNDVGAYQVQVSLPKGSIIPTVDNIWQL